MGLVIYNLLLPIYLLVALPGLLVKMKRRGGYGAHFGQRFGRYDAGTLQTLEARSGPSWWIHAVSVGEVLIALKLIERIRVRCPEQALLLSTTSSTGYATAREKAPEGVMVIYNPLDLPGIVRRVLRRLRPQLVVLMESELWPNLIASAARRGIPVVIANARLSSRSGRRYARFRRLAGPTLNRLRAVWTQEEEDSARWAAAGLSRSKIERLGSIKFDPVADRPPGEDQLGILREILDDLWGVGDRGLHVILLGSSHAGEETGVTEVYLRMRQRYPQIRLVLVPRHFERAEALVAELDSLGVPVQRRSLWLAGQRATPGAGEEPPLLLVDTTGELRAWYALAQAVIVGKSFHGRGGQNPVEPILAGRPVVVGPHMGNFAALTELLTREQGMTQVGDFAALESTLTEWLDRPEIPRRLAAAGRRSLEVHAGATDRTVEKLLALSRENA